jgi:hypothetical protein
MNVKMTEEFHARVHALASELGVSMSALVERFIYAIEETLTGTR